MNRCSRLLLAVAAALAVACAAAPPSPPEQRIAAATHLPKTGLQIVVAPKDAEVEIDGVRHRAVTSPGAPAGKTIPLAPGVHRVSVRRPGYATWRAEVSVHSRIERLDISLVKAP